MPSLNRSAASMRTPARRRGDSAQIARQRLSAILLTERAERSVPVAPDLATRNTQLLSALLSEMPRSNVEGR